MAKITLIDGIGEEYAQKLQKAGVTTTESLLLIWASPKGRKWIVEKSGLPSEFVARWVTQADLLRINGVGWQYADLLEYAGVNSVAELARRNAANLQQRMKEVNASKNLVHRLPPQSSVSDWVEQARSMPRVTGEWSGKAARSRETDFDEMPSLEESLRGEAAIDGLPGEGGTENIP